MSEKSGYAKKRAADKIKDAANNVVSHIIGYERKYPDMWDFYEGEAPIDWEQVVQLSPLRLVFQVTVGQHGRHSNDKPDYQVKNYISQALANKQKYGLYHLLVPNGIVNQAAFYIRWVEELGGLGNMMPIVDIEVDWVRGAAWADAIKQWKELIEDHFDKKVLAYTSKYYASFAYYPGEKGIHLPPPCFADMYGWMAGYLFVPYMDVNPIMPHSYLANGFMDWAAWQYYDKGRSNKPRGYQKFPANDVNLLAPWFVDLLNKEYS